MKVKCVRADGGLFEIGKLYDARVMSLWRIDVSTGDRFNTTMVCNISGSLYYAKCEFDDNAYVFIDEES